MFIKRLNKVYAPSLQTLDKLRRSQMVAPFLSQYAKQNESANIKPLQICSIDVDPHGTFVSMYSQKFDEIYIVSILKIINIFDTYRNEFSQEHQYSLKKPLMPDVIIKNERHAENIFKIKLSQRIQNTQFLVVAYYDGVINLYSVLNGKIIDSFDVIQNAAQLIQSKSPVFNINVIGHSTFVSTYNGTLLCYEGKELSECNKYKGEWVRLCYGQVYSSQQIKVMRYSKQKVQTSKLINKKLCKKVPVYYSMQGDLKIGEITIKQQHKQRYANTQVHPQSSKQVRQLLPCKQSQSYLEFMELEKQKLSLATMQNKYILSLCQRFIICKQEEFYLTQSVFSYQIRARFAGWKQLDGIVFAQLPVVNQFWGLLAHSKAEKQNILEQLDFLNYCMTSRDILVAVLGNHELFSQQKLAHFTNRKQITHQTTLSIVKIINNESQNYYTKVVCKLQDAKANITDFYWIAPNILLYLDQNSNIYYMEISTQLLM